MNWRSFVDLELTDDWELVLELGPIVLIAIASVALFIIFRVVKSRNLFQSFEAVELDVSLGNIGKIKVRPNYDDVQIAHRVWVELATRKAGLPLDRENDVIVEVYNSWYELFGEMRRLAKEVPAQRLRRSDTGEIVDLIVRALNDGLRPHLTMWQARFRHWYNRALADNPELTPQEVQRLYPRYDELVADLERVNGELQQYMGELKRLASGKNA